MGALLHHVAAVHNENFIGAAYGGQPVRDDKACSALHKLGHGLLDYVLGAGVDIGGGLVQNEHGTVQKHGAGDGEKLLLPLGDIDGVVGKVCVVALRQAGDEGVYLCRLAHSLHLLPRGVLLAVGYVFEHGARKQPCVLQHHGEAAAQARAGVPRYVRSVYLYRARIGVVEAHEKVDNRRLARARAADDGDELPLLCREGEVVNDLPALYVAEGEVLDIDVAADIGGHYGALVVGGFGHLLKHAEHAFGGGYCRLKLAEDVGNFVYGTRELARIEHEGGYLPHPRYACEGVHVHERAKHRDER